jgi:hypothetical protein
MRAQRDKARYESGAGDSFEGRCGVWASGRHRLPPPSPRPTFPLCLSSRSKCTVIRNGSSCGEFGDGRQPSASVFSRPHSKWQTFAVLTRLLNLLESEFRVSLHNYQRNAWRFWQPLRLAAHLLRWPSHLIRSTNGKLPTVHPRRLHHPNAFLSGLLIH